MTEKKLPFPLKLQELLADASARGWKDIVSWQFHGKAFRIHKPIEFVSMVMPRYFQQTKYKSFQRQLHIYGFHRISTGQDKGAYYHDLFVREDPSKCLIMTRKKIKGCLRNDTQTTGRSTFCSSLSCIDMNRDERRVDTTKSSKLTAMAMTNFPNDESVQEMIFGGMRFYPISKEHQTT